MQEKKAIASLILLNGLDRRTIMAKVGRPKGSTKPPTVPFHRRVRPEWIPILDRVIAALKRKK